MSGEKQVISKIESLAGHWGYTVTVFFIALIASYLCIDFRYAQWFEVHAISPSTDEIVSGTMIGSILFLVIMAMCVFKLVDESFYEYFRLAENESRMRSGQISSYEKTYAGYAYNALAIVIVVGYCIGMWAFIRYYTFEDTPFEDTDLWMFEIILGVAVALVATLFAYLASKSFDSRVKATPNLRYGKNR